MITKQHAKSIERLRFLCECLSVSRRRDGGGYDFISLPFQDANNLSESISELLSLVRGIDAFMKDNYRKEFDPIISQIKYCEVELVKIF